MARRLVRPVLRPVPARVVAQTKGASSVRPEYEALCAEVMGIITEAKKPEPVVTPPPSKKAVAATLQKMSHLAHQQSATAMKLGTPSALKLAAHTNLRVAHAANLHGVGKLAKLHAKSAQDLHAQGKKAKSKPVDKLIKKAGAAVRGQKPPKVPKEKGPKRPKDQKPKKTKTAVKGTGGRKAKLPASSDTGTGSPPMRPKNQMSLQR